MDYQWVKYEKEDGIAILTLNRPDKLNAWIPSMRVEARKCIEDANTDTGIRVLIVTGSGRGFCAGADLATFGPGEIADDEGVRGALGMSGQTLRVIEALNAMIKPTIAAINGTMAGSGLCFALAHDVLIASDQARFRVAFTRMGLPLPDAAAWSMGRLIGLHRTLELAYTNDTIDAKEMERIGLVNRVVPHDQLMKVAKETANKMKQIPPLTLALTKKAVYHALGAATMEEQIAWEHSSVFPALRTSEDFQEAAKSLMEKRNPVYLWK